MGIEVTMAVMDGILPALPRWTYVWAAKLMPNRDGRSGTFAFSSPSAAAYHIMRKLYVSVKWHTLDANRRWACRLAA